jgi:hypothetical protein
VNHLRKKCAQPIHLLPDEAQVCSRSASGCPIAHICAICNHDRQRIRKKNQEIGSESVSSRGFRPRSGKGSQGGLYYGDRFTTLKDRNKEIGTGLLKAMLDQLGLTRDDLEE